MINKPVIWYITLLSHRLTNRMADYAKKNDKEREFACKELQEDIIPVMALYGITNCKVPTTKQIAANPYSDINYLLELNTPITPLTDDDYHEIHQKIVKATFDYEKAHPNEKMTPKKMEQIKDQVLREEALRRSK
jgi:GTPase Era involved in 16S rRNA processing